jgi:hypothetical protein
MSRNVASAVGALAGLTQHGNTNRLGHQVVQQTQSLGHNLIDEKIDTCRVAARPSEAGDKTEPDRVFGDDEDDGDRRGCRLGRQS